MVPHFLVAGVRPSDGLTFCGFNGQPLDFSISWMQPNSSQDLPTTATKVVLWLPRSWLDWWFRDFELAPLFHQYQVTRQVVF